MNNEQGMKDQQVVEIYQAVTEAENLSCGQVAMSVETGEWVEDYQKLLTIVADFQQQQGWLCYQSEVLILKESEGLASREDKILHGELAKNNQSLHIQQVDHGWWITRIIEGSGEPCLIKRQCYSINEDEQACYHVYWKYSEQGYQADSYRFVGFSPAQGES